VILSYESNVFFGGMMKDNTRFVTKMTISSKIYYFILRFQN